MTTVTFVNLVTSVFGRCAKLFVAIATIVVTMLGVAGTAGAQDAPPPPPPAPKSLAAQAPGMPGNPTTVEFVRPGGEVRSAIVSVTSNYDPARPTPVMFGFGGWGDSPENFRNYSRFNATPAASEAIVVYPKGIEHAWEGAPYAVTPRGADVDFVRQIVAELQHHFNVDRNRIYGVGMSNGGGMIAALACQAPDLMAGVVGISGAYYNPVHENCVDGASVPTFLIHGSKDEMTFYNGGSRHGAPFWAVPDLIHQRSVANGCAPDPVVVELPGNVTQFGYSGCRDEAVHWRVNDSIHDWYFTPDVANEAWNFLARQNLSLPGPAA